jgi:hypothetical protein
MGQDASAILVLEAAVTYRLQDFRHYVRCFATLTAIRRASSRRPTAFALIKINVRAGSREMMGTSGRSARRVL